MDIEQLVDDFEAGRIGGDEFPHRRHVQVAWGLARRYGREEGLRRMIAGIRGIAERAGHPEAYHDTITRAWFLLIASADELERHPELLDKALLRRYYSAERLAAGRNAWLGPDLHALSLPPARQNEDSVGLAATMRGVPASVAVLAVRAQDTVHAATVSSMVSVSREPPLVSVCLANGSRALELLLAAKAFTLSVLSCDQDNIATRFADSARPPGAAQFDGVSHELRSHGPVIDNASAWLECELHAAHRCGDHHIVIGKVGGAAASNRRPLVQHDGVYR